MSATIHDLTLRLRPRFGDPKYDVTCWCEHCGGEVVRYDWRKPRQLCGTCEREATGVTPLDAA